MADRIRVIRDGSTQSIPPSDIFASVGHSIRNLKASNTLKIRAAMASPSRNALVACVGPSTTAGLTINGGASQAVNAWPAQLARILQAQGIPAGANSFFGDHAGWGLGGGAAGYMAGDNRFVATGSASPQSTNSVGGLMWYLVNADGSITFIPQAPVTKFDIYLRDNGFSGTFAWSVDGGAATNVGGTDTKTVRKITVAAGASGIHTLKLAWVAGIIGIVGVVGYDDTGGRREISFLNWGISGATSAGLITNTDAPSIAGRLSAWTQIAPDLSILGDWAINDWRQSVPIDVFQANLAAGIAQGKLTGDVIVATPLWDASTLGASPQQEAYAAATIATALAADVPVLDVRSAWVSYAAGSAAGLYSDSVHPTPTGYAMQAACWAELFRRIRGI